MARENDVWILGSVFCSIEFGKHPIYLGLEAGILEPYDEEEEEQEKLREEIISRTNIQEKKYGLEYVYCLAKGYKNKLKEVLKDYKITKI